MRSPCAPSFYLSARSYSEHSDLRTNGRGRHRLQIGPSNPAPESILSGVFFGYFNNNGGNAGSSITWPSSIVPGDIKEQQLGSLPVFRARATTYALLIYRPRGRGPGA